MWKTIIEQKYIKQMDPRTNLVLCQKDQKRKLFTFLGD